MNSKEKGITLIALVVTIIVLLILAGVTISLVLGQNGIFGKAQIAKEETRAGAVEEQASLWKLEIEANKYIESKTTTETLDQILSRLQNENLLTAKEVETIKKADNINKEITIGSKTISFKVDTNTKDPSGEIIGDGSYVNGVSTPKLGSAMTPIVYDTTATGNGNIPSSWRKANNEKEWYNYDKQKWANAVTEDGSMWVWIPRYEYKILSGEGTSAAGKIAVNFIPVATNSKNGGVTTGYRIHPAFENGSSTGKNNNFMNGEWDSELSGIWVAKFEASRSDSTASVVGTSNTTKIQPDVKSWGDTAIGDIYTNSLNMFPTYNSHLMKNSEWGMAAYLTQSKYGRNKTEVTINSKYATGGGDYKTNTNQSTTKNTTGIYDVSGGTWEQTAGYISNGNANLSTYGSSLVGVNVVADTEGYKTKSTKYVTVYPYNSSDSDLDNYTTYKGLKTNDYGYGDGVLEISTFGSGSTSWNEDYSYFPATTAPFFCRGGLCYSGSGAGVFSFSLTGGNVHPDLNFRPVLAL